jgi:hypothetical protein
MHKRPPASQVRAISPKRRALGCETYFLTVRNTVRQSLDWCETRALELRLPARKAGIRKKEPMQVYVKRSKIFFDNSGKTEQCVRLPASPLLQTAPDWIRTAPGFDLGVKDGSIVEWVPPVEAALSELQQQLKDRKDRKTRG